MKAYRVEHAKSHDGPYNHIPEDNWGHSHVRDLLISSHGWNPLFPGWGGWFQDAIDYRHIAGFESLDDLIMWFGNEILEAARDEGFVIAEYEVTEFAAAYYGHWHTKWTVDDDCVAYIRHDGLRQIIFIGEPLDTYDICLEG